MFQAAPNRRRHTERARLRKRLPQSSVQDPDLTDLGDTNVGDDLPGPITLTKTVIRPQTTTSSPATIPTVAQPPPPPPSPSTLTTPTPSPAAGISEAGNTPVQATKASKGGLSGGGIAGVVITVLVIVAGIVVFLMRKRFMSMRQKKRATWNGGVFAKSANISSPKPIPDGTPMPWDFPQTTQTISAPPMSYNNPSAVLASVNPTGPKASPSATTATVRCTFIPSLPDELSIVTGEVVRVVQEYDDGWALCANTRGEQGMVPLECLEKSTMTPNYSGADWRNAQRASSLVSPGGSRY